MWFPSAIAAGTPALRHTSPMRSPVKPMTSLLWVIAFAFVAVRMTEVHWHLCFDGLEPRSSVHVGDRAAHHESHDEGAVEHVDTDVPLTGQILAKLTKVDFDLPLAVLGAFLLWVVGEPRRVLPIARRIVPANTPPFFLRPPLRGPPR